MKKLSIQQVLNCNRTLFKIFEQQSTFPVSIGFKIFSIMKKFDEVEEYVFNVLEMTFQDIDFNSMTEEQKMFYNNVVSSEIELDFETIDEKFFKENETVMLTIEDISNLGIILKEKQQ